MRALRAQLRDDATIGPTTDADLGAALERVVALVDLRASGRAESPDERQRERDDAEWLAGFAVAVARRQPPSPVDASHAAWLARGAPGVVARAQREVGGVSGLDATVRERATALLGLAQRLLEVLQTIDQA